MPSTKYLDETGLAYYDGTVEDRFNPLNAYPVGSIYMSVNSTSPATLFGGTWEQIQDVFLLAAGSTYTAGDTGGSASHTLIVDELPSHVHTVPKHGHANTIAATTPKFTQSRTQPAFNTPKFTHSYTRPTVSSSGAVTSGISGGAHVHTLKFADCGYSGSGATKLSGSGSKQYSDMFVSTTGTHTHNLPNHTHTLTGGSVGDHAATACTRATNVGVGDHAATACTMSGSVTDKDAFDTNSTGSGQAISILPPYLSVYTCKRTA